jgi:protein-ribulosamine 3-kinase
MLTAPIQNYLNQLFADKMGSQIISVQTQPVGGGSINAAYKITVNKNERFFLKVNSNTTYPSLFDKEKNGLDFISRQKIIKVPAIIVCDEVDDRQVLLLEWIENGLRNGQSWKQFGEQLAKLHRVTNSFFGFEEDNYMGALPQLNKAYTNWVEFFIHCRLQPQLKLAAAKGAIQKKQVLQFEKLYKLLPGIFNSENPSLLHGDLWSGNFMCNESSNPVLIDPAVYFGHRSMDLAMTTLFGGFDKLFYESYNYHFPFPVNYYEQWEICNLYPLLIHLNLFGSGYLHQVENILEKFS